jgi:outer membrane protein assembly factor BamE (lipoprotein component of BamABCDE complex)
MRRARLASVLGASLLAAGCFTVGRSFPTRQVAAIEVGSTTREQIERTFGEPFRVGLEDGQQTWTYGHYRYSLFGNPVTRDLVLRFDERGVVASYSFNTTEAGDL